MNLTASDVSSLADTLTKWEYAEYFFAGLVTVACFGEFAAEFTNWFTSGVEHRKKHFEKISTLVLVGGLALELVCLVRTNSLSGKLIGSLRDQAKQAVAASGKAVEDSRKATDESDRARATASDAIGLANSAKREADSFEKDIASAKQQAAEAESHLAEAVSMARAEETELLRLEKQVAPRVLSADQQRLIRTALTKFSGRSVVVSTYGMDGEGAAVGTQIISVLTGAGIRAVDNRAQTIVAGGFDFGIHVRGPVAEEIFVLAIADALSSIGKLQVWTNKGIARPGVQMGGGVAIGGPVTLGGGGGPPGADGPTASGTPVTIAVGIKPVEILLAK